MTAETTFDVTVRGIASGGAGVADLPDGRIVFVPRTAPGDRARIEVVRSRPRWALGSLRRLLEPGPERREALCALYGTCGGCQLQHLPYERQLVWKGRIVADALARIGGLGPVEPPEVVPSANTTGYRNRVSFTLRRLRGGRVVAGFHALDRPAHVVDVHDECVLPEPSVAGAWAALRAGWGTGARLLPAAGRLRLTLRAGRSGVELVVEGGPAGWKADALVARVPALLVVRHRPGEEGAPAALVYGAADAGLGTAFVQANDEAAAALRAHVLAVAGPPGRAVDAYCGVGEVGRGLAAAGWRVIGIELDAAAASFAAADAPGGFSVLEGRVEDRLSDAWPADLVVLNPPRAGLHPDVPPMLLRSAPERIVYVSCDPATLARDLGLLAAGYALAGLRGFDLFPQTARVEAVAVLGRVRGTT